MYLARGGHDKTAYQDVFIPQLKPVKLPHADATYYSFGVENCKFIFLDYITYSLQGHDAEQTAWLENELRTCRNDDHVFLFAHPPLISVARVFFNSPRFTEDILAVLKRYEVDAYFCGHTHNQALTIHPVGSRNLLQIKTCPLSFEKQPAIALEEVSSWVSSRHDLKYLWGYFENSASVWISIEVDDRTVTLDWHVLGKGVQGRLRWVRGGTVEIPQRPDLPQNTVPWRSGLAIEKAEIAMALLNSTSPSKRIYLNAVDVGTVPVGTCYSSFAVPIPKETVRQNNRVRVTHPEKEHFGLGDVYLNLHLTDGSICRSQVAPRIHLIGEGWPSLDADVAHAHRTDESVEFAIEFGQ
jgi:hypothetical protein